jgi:DNA-binding protein YbaB
MAEQSDDPFQRVLQELQETVSELEDADRRLSVASYTGRSKDRCVEVTVGPQGEVTQVKFLADKYRSLSGDELGASVLEASQRARAHMAQAMLDTFKPLTSRTESMRRARSNNVGINWDRILGKFEEDVAVADTTRTRKKKPTLRDEIVEDPETREPRVRPAVPGSDRGEGGQSK